MHPLLTYLNRIWRYRWLVLVITVLATLGALLYTVSQPITYTARSTLTTASKNRSPDQDAYLAEGYAEYFNQESYQGRIRSLAQVPKEVRLHALTGATSPILYIEATGPDPAIASLVASKVAERFPDDVQDIANASRDEELASIERRIKDNQALLDKLDRDSDQRAVILAEIFSLQQQAKDLRGNTTNQLIDLQRDAGVSARRPSPVLNGLFGLAGGLALGCAAALALAVLRNRIATPDDMQSVLGLPTLAWLDSSRRRSDDQTRAQRLQSLSAVLSLADLPRPATLAITAPRRSSLTSHIAEGIAYYQALQGSRTLLMRADLRGAAAGGASHDGTVAGLLAGASTEPARPIQITVGGAEMLVLPAGVSSTTDPFALFAPAEFDALLRQLSHLADLIVIEAPPVNEAAESQIICAAADRTVLVVEEGITPGRDASRACQSLIQVGASLLGGVLGRPLRTKRHAEPFSTLSVPDTLRSPSAPQSSYLTSPNAEVVVGAGANEGDPSSAPLKSPAASRNGDSASPGAPAESRVAVLSVLESAPTETVNAPRVGSDAGPSSSAEDNTAGQDDEGPDTEPMAALKDSAEQASVAEEDFNDPAEPAMGDSALQAHPDSLAAEYLLYSDTQPTMSAVHMEPPDPRNATLFAPPKVPAAEPAMPPPVSPDLDTSRLTLATPPGPALLPSVSGLDRWAESMILATVCPDAHSNPPTAANCRVCGALIPPQVPRLVSRPVLCVLRADDGTRAEVDRAVVVGRAPDPSRSHFKAPRLMSLHDPGGDVSRTHVEVAPKGWQVVATDLKSTNGTVLVRPGGKDRHELTPGEHISVEPGSVLELGNGVSITVELPSGDRIVRHNASATHIQGD